MPDPDLKTTPLAALSLSEMAALSRLPLTERQEYWGGSFGETLATWRGADPQHCLGIALRHRAQLVGACLFKRPPLAPDWVSPLEASMHGLKIAQDFQGRGWGHHALCLCVDHLKSVWPDRRRLVLAVDADNAAALAVYRGFGMTGSEGVVQGDHGPEYRLEISLAP